MYRELVIALIIVISIFILDYVMQKYTDDVINEATSDLRNLENDINEEIEDEKIKQSVRRIHDNWKEKQNTLSYYIEHNELEKVETNLVSGKSLIESTEYTQALSELEKTIFVLEHINDKYSFNLKNIF